MRPGGNWEGHSILHTPRPAAQVAAELGIDEAELRRRLDVARPVLFAARAERVPPALDDKVLTAWNGLAILAFAEGHRILGDPDYLDAATRAADFVLDRLVDGDGELLRAWRAGKAQHRAVLEDYAYLGEGLLALYETGGERRFLDRALALAETLRRRFGDGEGGFFHTAAGQRDLLLRYRDGTDGATPAANAAAAELLVRLAAHLDRGDLRRRAVAALAGWGELVERAPRAFAKSLLVVDFLAAESAGRRLELAFVGRRGEPGLTALEREVGRRFLPHRIQAVGDPERAATVDELPLFAGKSRRGDAPALYVCRGFACRAPVTAPGEVAAALAVASATS